MAHVNVRFFGPARDLVDRDDRQCELSDGLTLGGLAGRLVAEFPQLGPVLGIRLAVNRRYVPLDYALRDGDEVAVIPPVSGG